MAFRPRTDLPKLGHAVPSGPILLDTNVLVNALTGRGPAILRLMIAHLPSAFVSSSTRAEMAWLRGRLDPIHPSTSIVLAKVDQMLSAMVPSHVLTPSDEDWVAAGKLAGRAAREIGSGGRKIATAFDRVELISDALIAHMAHAEGLTIITEDADFDVLMRLLPDLNVLFYDRVTQAG